MKINIGIISLIFKSPKTATPQKKLKQQLTNIDKKIMRREKRKIALSSTIYVIHYRLMDLYRSGEGTSKIYYFY